MNETEEYGDLNHKSYFEKLKVKELYISSLLVEQGKLQSEIDELKYLNNQLESKLKAKNITPQENKTIKVLRNENRLLINKLMVAESGIVTKENANPDFWKIIEEIEDKIITAHSPQ